MRIRWSFLAIALLAVPMVSAGQIFHASPERPTVGQTVTLTYDAGAPGATLGGKPSLRGEVLLMPETEEPVLLPLQLSAKGTTWTGSFLLNNPRARVLLFRVLAGKAQENGPLLMVFGKNGKPLHGANLQRGSLLASGGFIEFRLTKEYAAAHAAIAEEKALYPDNWRVYPAEWNTVAREDRGEGGQAKIKASLDEYCKRFKGNGEAMAAVLPWLVRTGQKERGEAIQKVALESAPTGPVAEAARRNAIFAEPDVAKRADLIEKFLADFPQKGEAKSDLEALQFSLLMKAKETEKGLALLDRMERPNPNLLNSVAWGWIEKGENLEQAVRIAGQGVNAALHRAPEEKPTYLSDEAWKEQSDVAAAMVLDTYGLGLFKLGKFLEAEAAFRQAFDISGGKEGELTERLLMAYNKNGKYKEAIEAGRSAIERGETTEKLIEYYKTAYVALKGSEAGFESDLAEAKAAGAKRRSEEILQSRQNKPAVPFALKDLEGKSVRLADMKGRVVVLDFWATWCGPCKRSFPTLQKVFEKYRENPSVQILALDTWENVKGEEREVQVKKFLTENGYTFPVLFDEGFVDKYGVEGIPTKFVIDRRGRVAFTSIGFNGAEEMLEELTTQIDILLAEKP